MEQMIKNVRRIKRAIGDGAAALFGGSMLASVLLSGLAGLLLAVCKPAEGIAPFGLGCAAGVWFAGISPYFACAGAFAGYLISKSPAYAAASALLTAVIFILERTAAPKRVYRLLTAFACELTALLINALFTSSPAVFAFGAASVSVASAMVIGGGIKAAGVLTSKRELGDAELLALAASAGLITLSFGNISILGQSPGMIFAGFCSLVLAYRCGAASVAFAVTAAAGRVLVTGGDMHFMAVLAASALIASSLRSLGKTAVMLGFAAIDLLFLLFMRGTSILSLFETAACCALFMLLPRSLYMPVGASGPHGVRRSPSGASPGLLDARYNSMQYSVSGIADVLCALARVYGGELGQMLVCISDTLQRTVSGSGTASRAEFAVQTGCAAIKKSQSSRSGDSLIIKSIDPCLLLAISDGMGSGDEAGRQSRETVGLLSDLITVGFDMQAAAECINRLMALRASSDMYATLDAMLLDLTDGSARLLKLGAPTSYVIRRGKLYSLYAENLPVGITSEADAPIRKIALKKGDSIIMMTDGVMDSLGSGLMAALSDCGASCGNAQEAAEAVLRLAARNGACDDMTVIWADIA